MLMNGSESSLGEGATALNGSMEIELNVFVGVSPDGFLPAFVVANTAREDPERT